MVQIVLRSEKYRDLILQKVSIELAKKFVCIFLLDIPQNGFSTGDPYNFALFHLVFIHRNLLFLGLDDFPASELVHIITLTGATFLR